MFMRIVGINSLQEMVKILDCEQQDLVSGWMNVYSKSVVYRWPQYAFPPFRILKSTCLQKVGVGEQICLARMKVPWPLTEREMILHYFSFEYFKDGLVVILLNTISDLNSIGVSSTDIIIPESPDAVRMDLVGGFVLQKVTPQRSYFRLVIIVVLQLVSCLWL
jgi:hypothetical protein